MARQVSRRQLLQGFAAGTAALAATGWTFDSKSASAADFDKPVPGAAGLTAYHKDDTILVRYDNLPIVGYRAQSSLKYPYFCPLNGPGSGLPLTAESALPYPHHRGLWLGCDPLNGGNYWADNGLKSGQIRSEELVLESKVKGEAKLEAVKFRQACRWTRSGSNPLDDTRRVTITRPSDRLVLIDCEFQLTAGEDISIKGAKHSFFAMRAAADISPSYGGTMINSAGGVNAAGTYGKTADWCGYFGKRRFRPDVVEGIVIMNHPKNFGGKCPWFTRDYGHLSPSPLNFLDKPWTLAQGATLDLSYRVVLFVGTPQQARLDAIYREWLG